VTSSSCGEISELYLGAYGNKDDGYREKKNHT
jgi:hypothetical protein